MLLRMSQRCVQYGLADAPQAHPPPGNCAKLPLANIKDHDTNTVVMSARAADQTDDAGVYQTNLTITVVNN